MKKLLVFIIAALLILSLPCAGVFAAYTAELSVSSTEAKTGETAEVLVSIQNNPGLCALGFEITYDASALKVKSADFSTMFASASRRVNVGEGKIIFNAANADNVDGNGTVATIVFEVVASNFKGAEINIRPLGDKGFVLHSEADRSLTDVELKLNAGSVMPSGGAATDTPVTDAPVTDAPVTDTPVTDAPVTDAPVTDAPACTHGETVKETVKSATCDEKGVVSVKCSACGALLGEEELAALEHQWGEWVTKKEPTEKEEGKAEQSCALCGKTNEKTLDKLPAATTADTTEADTATVEPKPADKSNTVTVILLIVAVAVAGGLGFFTAVRMKKEKQARDRDFM